jgi:4'-phosphopantetheinyl transferase
MEKHLFTNPIGTPRSLEALIRVSAPPLDVNVVHVWPVHLDSEAPIDIEWAEFISQDELARARRFKFPRDAYCFSASRALLRSVLATYAHCQPRDLIFGYTQKGKPFLTDDRHLRFNISHGDTAVLIGVTLQREIGVDVERVRYDFNVDEIAQRFFSSAEREAFAKLPMSQKHRAFFECWTRKEAFVKATGEGLSLPLDQFDVSFRPGEPAQLLATRPDPQEATRWEFVTPNVGPAYAAAIITQTGSKPLTYWVSDPLTAAR